MPTLLGYKTEQRQKKKSLVYIACSIYSSCYKYYILERKI